MNVRENLLKYLKIISILLIGGFIMSEVYAAAARPETQGTIEQVNIITPHKIQIKGQNLQLKDQIIKLVGPRGAAYMAKYDDKQEVFEMPSDELTIGVPYTLQANFAHVPKAFETIAIPNVIEVKLTSPTTLEIIYDTEVDLTSATKVENYWIRTSEERASGIASLGKDEAVNESNALTTKQASIAPKDASNKVMVMTFVKEATPGVEYSLIPCFISRVGSQGYRGGNFISSSRLDFKVQ